MSYLEHNINLMKEGELYIHSKSYICHKNIHNCMIRDHIFFITNDHFKPIFLKDNEVFLFINMKIYPQKKGIKYKFLFGKDIIESYYEEANKIIIFEPYII